MNNVCIHHEGEDSASNVQKPMLLGFLDSRWLQEQDQSVLARMGCKTQVWKLRAAWNSYLGSVQTSVVHRTQPFPRSSVGKDPEARGESDLRQPLGQHVPDPANYPGQYHSRALIDAIPVATGLSLEDGTKEKTDPSLSLEIPQQPPPISSAIKARALPHPSPWVSWPLRGCFLVAVLDTAPLSNGCLAKYVCLGWLPYLFQSLSKIQHHFPPWTIACFWFNF